MVGVDCGVAFFVARIDEAVFFLPLSKDCHSIYIEPTKLMCQGYVEIEMYDMVDVE